MQPAPSVALRAHQLDHDDPDLAGGGDAAQGGQHGDDYHWISGLCADMRCKLFGFAIKAGSDD